MAKKPVKLAPGDVLSAKYEITRVLGQGGMGIVYEAIHRRLGRRVAVKTILVEHIDREFLERFEREARVGALLDSKHVATVYDIDTTNDGTVFLVMELLKGSSLADLMQREAIAIENLLQWTIEVCDVLERAHAAGIIHRDIKPENIFVCNGTPRFAKVLDFGIAKLVNAEDLTMRGALTGTPMYMAPEQLLGAAPDPRWDQFSLGVLLYECLAARMPFDEKHPSGYMVAVIKDRPTPLRDVRPDVPPVVADVVMRMLQKAQGDRYGSMHDARTALEEAIAFVRRDSSWLESASTASPATQAKGERSTEAAPATLKDSAPEVPTAFSGRPRAQSWFVAAAVGAVLIGGAAMGVIRTVQQPKPRPQTTTVVEAEARVAPITRSNAATSPTREPEASAEDDHSPSPHPVGVVPVTRVSQSRPSTSASSSVPPPISGPPRTLPGRQTLPVVLQ